MRANPTEAERRLWSILRAKRLAGFKFKRQAIIDSYIVDFVNFDHRLVIEADGSQHAESDYDKRRDAYLKRQGFTVLRFWNSDVLGDSESVTEAIWHALHAPPSPFRRFAAPSLSRKGRGLGLERIPCLTPITSSSSAPDPAAMSRRNPVSTRGEGV